MSHYTNYMNAQTESDPPPHCKCLYIPCLFVQFSSITTPLVQKPHISSVTADLNCKNNFR